MGGEPDFGVADGDAAVFVELAYGFLEVAFAASKGGTDNSRGACIGDMHDAGIGVQTADDAAGERLHAVGRFATDGEVYLKVGPDALDVGFDQLPAVQLGVGLI